MTTLHDVYDQQGQSPWLDNLRRDWLQDGTLAGLVAQGIRGVTSNPTIFAKAISGQDTYDDQFRSLIATTSVEDAYWDLVVDDIQAALAVLRPVFDSSGGADGFVSVEVAPALAHDTEGTTTAARGRTVSGSGRRPTRCGRVGTGGVPGRQEGEGHGATPYGPRRPRCRWSDRWAAAPGRIGRPPITIAGGARADADRPDRQDTPCAAPHRPSPRWRGRLSSSPAGPPGSARRPPWRWPGPVPGW